MGFISNTTGMHHHGLVFHLDIVNKIVLNIFWANKDRPITIDIVQRVHVKLFYVVSMEHGNSHASMGQSVNVTQWKAWC